MEWKNININKNQIKTETYKAVLVKMPNNSRYAGYKFWHPAKLIRNGKHSAALSLSYNDDFSFKLFKNGNGKYNKYDVIDEDVIGVDDFESAFGITNKNITAPILKNEFETHKPEKLDIKEVEILQELKEGN